MKRKRWSIVFPVKSMGMSVDEDQYFELEVVEDSTTAEFG